MSVFTDRFKYMATFQRATYATNGMGQEERSLENLYVNVPCNLKKLKDPFIHEMQGQARRTILKWRCDVNPYYSDGARKDIVTIGIRSFTVVDVEQKLDMYGRTAFYYYYLEEIL